MNATNWVLFDRTQGSPTHGGQKVSLETLGLIAEAVQEQVNNEFAAEWGSQTKIRVGKDANDINAGEWAYIFVPQLPNAPGASAYHDITAKGVPYALCAVSTCEDLFGPNGVSVDASHEILETAGDEGANLYAYDNKGLLHAMEMCDAVEVQTYPKKCRDGTVVHVSNWVLRAWFMLGAKGPYEYMSAAKLPGAVPPPGPLLTAPGHNGNYQIVGKWTAATKDVFAAHGSPATCAPESRIEGVRHKGQQPHWSSRTALRLAQMNRQDWFPEAHSDAMRFFGQNRLLGSRVR
jgi:hypothetical protein